jgi:TetR/AcrR family tetracycline transcriptional repressor
VRVELSPIRRISVQLPICIVNTAVKVTHMTKDTAKRRSGTNDTPSARHQKGRKRAERILNPEAIIAAALEEIDRGGLANFSVRNLAKRLGVYPTAVAWHVPGKSQLLVNVVTLALADVLPPGFPESWQSYLRQFFHRFRDAIRRHPNVAPLIGAQLVANPAVELDLIEMLLATLSHAGLSGLRLLAAYNAVIAAVVGFTTQEFAPTPAEETKSWQKEIRDRLQNVQPTRYPILAGNMKLLANKAFILRWQSGTEAPMDGSFESFVEIVIAGLESFAAPA